MRTHRMDKWKRAGVLLLAALLTMLTAVVAAEGKLDDGSPWVDYDLSENVAKVTERPANPKDDLQLYVNYDWAKAVKIRPGYGSESSFMAVSDEIRKMGMEVLTDKTLQGEDVELVQGMYEAILDWDARNALGVEPIRKAIESIQAVSNMDELTALFCDTDSIVKQFISVAATVGKNDPETYLLSIDPLGLLLADSAEYKTRTEMGERNEAAYRKLLEKVMPKLGVNVEEAGKIWESALALETELAGAIMTSADHLSPDYDKRTNNEMNAEEAWALCRNYPIFDIVSAQGYGHAKRCLVSEPAYVQKLDEIYTEDHLEKLKNYLITCAALDHLGTLDKECHDLLIEANNMISGSTGSRPDEETAYAIVCSTLTTPMNRAFLAKYDSTKMKEEVTRICEESIAYYRELLSTEEWLSDETRKKAVEKLDAIRINAVYPEKWRDYSGLSLKGLGFYDSVNAIRKFEKAYNASLLNTKVDHDLWNFDILATNAYYEPLENSINIIRGILGGVFYREDMTTEELYAGIGSVIGHEISHAFDTSGAQFDATGAMNDWWTKEDYAAFLGRAQKLIDYYNSMTAFGGYKVQGANIQGEAIADMAGMKCMLGLLSKKENVDYRRFFESYAKIWARINTRETEYYQLMQDPHPLSYLRTNVTVQQFDEFLETFDIVEGDGMYLSPEDRVLVW